MNPDPHTSHLIIGPLIIPVRDPILVHLCVSFPDTSGAPLLELLCAGLLTHVYHGHVIG